MKFLMFSVFDQCASAFLPPFVLPEVRIAERTFGDCVTSRDHAFGKHPADYTLFELGSFESDDGLVSAYGAPRLVVNGEVLKARILEGERIMRVVEARAANGGEGPADEVSRFQPKELQS